MPPKNIFFLPTPSSVGSPARLKLLVTALSHESGWRPSGAVKLHLIRQMCCHAKSEQIAHWIYLAAFQAVLCSIYTEYADSAMMNFRHIAQS